MLDGTGEVPVTVSYVNRFGRQRKYQTNYEGLIPWLTRRHEGADSESARETYEQYMRLVPCDSCDGARLNLVSLAVTVGDRNIHHVSSLPLRNAHAFVTALELDDRDRKIAEAVLKEITARLAFLLDVGLDYLTLARGAATLAGGRGAADPTGDADRIRTRGRALHPRRTVDRPPPTR